METIRIAAVKTPSGRVWEGKRHGDCFRAMKDGGVPRLVGRVSAQGFVTSKGRYVSREEAGRIALAAGQTDELKESLDSADLILEGA